ncbi:hypothetical protein B0T19DRAFT_441045 [Cercophora scortea]|uniref:Uncharacterized protein n=1 Tax=Cercophora scortea TaxID=314031 RepID=A0AAE0MDG1_9PEZI|nr:hypothetical protein B0T19DRAFT_441045 [Cercophora scortea]
MHLLHSLTTLLASGAALALAVPAKLVARDSPFSDLDLPADFWGNMDNYCRNGVPTKRRSRSVPGHPLDRRASKPSGYQEVAPGTYTKDFEAVTVNGAWTDFLVTCFGVVIIGDSTNAVSYSKFLAHFYATPSLLDSLWTDVKNEVTAQGLTNLRGWISLPDRSTAPADLDQNDMLTVENTMRDLVTQLTGQAPTVRYHNMADASARVGDVGTMQYNNADKTVLIDGTVVEFGT